MKILRAPSRRLRRLIAPAVLAIALSAGWAGWLQASGNFHPVAEGQVYRSAQPTPARLARWAHEDGIRSVLNLRGASEAGWYGDEVAASRSLGLVHADFGMSASRGLTAEQADRLVALIDSLPKPLLIHCSAGADRTGLAAALYLATHGAGEGPAERQISFRFGHVSLPFSAAWPIDQSWEALEPHLGLKS